MKLKMLQKVVSFVVILSFVFSNVSFACPHGNLRTEQPGKTGVDQELKNDLQRTWIGGNPTPPQVIDAQAATQEYLIEAGRDKRIFSVAGPGVKDIKEQVAQYAAERTSVARQLPYLDEKGQAKLVDRITKALEFHNSMVNFINSYLLSDVTGDNLKDVSDRVGEVKSEIQKDIRFTIVLDESGKPFFFKDGDVINGKVVTVTATSGGFKYPGYEATKMYQKGQRPRTIYRTLDEIEGYMELAQTQAEAKDAYIYKLLHEYFELQAGSKRHRIESATVTQKVNGYDELILAKWQKKQDELAAKKAEYDRNKVVAEITSANISKFLNPELDGAIPKTAIEAVEAQLQKLVDRGILVDFKVFANGGDIHIYSTRSNAQSDLEAALATQGVINSFRAAVSLPELDFNELVKDLEVRRTFKPLAFGERKAEAIGVLNASGTYVGAFNEFIWEVLCNPMTTAGLTIDPQGDRGFAIEVWDSIENKTYLFNSIIENKKLRVLISEPGRYAIVAAYPPAEHKVPSDEPILAVCLKRIFDDGKTSVGDANPTLVIRTQSGLPAWGEMIEGFAKGQPIVTYGGEKTRHMLAWRPTDIAEANEWSRSRAGKRSILTGFGYQSHQKGAIAPAKDMTGDKTLDVVRNNADKWNDIFSELPDYMKDIVTLIEPFNRPHPYDRDNKVDASYELLKQDGRFVKNPDPKKQEADPLLADKGDITVSTIKADVGSVPGHFIVHPYTMEGAPEMLEIARQLGIGAAKKFVEVANAKKAELKARIKKGEKISAERYAQLIGREAQKFLKEFKPISDDVRIVDYKVWQVGDDIQITIQHYQGAESQLIHSLAWDTLIYAAEKSELAQPYGYKQDILVDRLVSGNVQGAGPGYAEVSIKEGESLVGFSGDKCAPGVFTVPLLSLINKVLGQGKFSDGLIAEIWDINHSNRVFLDMTDPSDYQEALDLLRAPDRFAIKRIWETNPGWKERHFDLKKFRNLPSSTDANLYSYLRKILKSTPLVSASTERLVLTAGEYVGKDDPTILFKVSDAGLSKDDVVGIWQYTQVALGFMSGSHVGPIMPDVQGKALPHRFDGPPPMSGWVINNVTKQAKALAEAQDAFANQEWLGPTQAKANFVADVLRRQGAFPPHVVEGPDKEYTTAPKVMAALAAEKRGVDAGNQAEELVANANPKIVSEKLATMLRSSVQDGNKALSALPNLETADRDELGMFSTDTISEETTGLIFSIEALSQGLGAIIPGLANRGKQIAVVVEKDHPEQLQIVTELNDYIVSGPQKIYVAFSVENAAEVLKRVVPKVAYIGTDEDSGKTFHGVDKVIIARQIIAALGKIQNMTDALEEFKEAYKLIRIQV